MVQWGHWRLISPVHQWTARLYASSMGSWGGIRNEQAQWSGVKCTVNRAVSLDVDYNPAPLHLHVITYTQPVSTWPLSPLEYISYLRQSFLTSDYHVLPQTIISYPRLSFRTSDYHFLPQTIISYLRLSFLTADYHFVPQTIISYLRLSFFTSDYPTQWVSRK